jgi:hypothetical protein
VDVVAEAERQTLRIGPDGVKDSTGVVRGGQSGQGDQWARIAARNTPVGRASVAIKRPLVAEWRLNYNLWASAAGIDRW